MSFANLSKGITWCLPGLAQCLSSQCLSDGSDQCLSELGLTCLCLPISVMRTLLMSSRTELVCLLANIFLVSSISVYLKCFPTSFAKSVWRDHLMSSWISPMSFFPVSVWWVWSVSVRAGSHLSLSANVCCEEPADVYLNWTRVSSCQYLSSEFNRCLPEVFPTAFLSVSFYWNHLISAWILSERLNWCLSNLLPTVSEQSCLKGLRSFC